MTSPHKAQAHLMVVFPLQIPHPPPPPQNPNPHTLPRAGTMTLLAAITAGCAAQAPAAAGATQARPAAAHPIVLTPGAAPPPPPPSAALPTPIPPSAWSLAPADPDLAAAASSLAATVPSCNNARRFRKRLANFLAALAKSLSLPPPPPDLTDAVRPLAPYFPAAVASLAASAAARFGEHGVVFALAEARRLPHPPPGVLALLADGDRPDAVCAVLRQAADLRSAELLAALRCFLSPASDEAYEAMEYVKARWKDAAVRAVGRCREEGAEKKARPVARRPALLLMMGHDGFSSPEVCLHYLLASGNVDSVLLGAAVAELDGGEVIRLMRYLNKWIAKYRRFPEAQVFPEVFPEAVDMLGLEQCESVPSFGAVARALAVVLDNHFSHLVLNADVREELRAADRMVRELAAEAESSGPILDLLHRLQQDK
ncbi:hypothetical protein ACP4OV_022432 [Aristida adscensionis]